MRSQESSLSCAEACASPEVPLGCVVDGETVRLSVGRMGLPRVHIAIPLIKRYSGSPPFEDLQIRSALGKGNYGCVRLVVDRNTHVGYALKSMRKGGQHSTSARMLVRERCILSTVHGASPFLAGCIEAYQDVAWVHILMPLASGGELSKMLAKHTHLSLPATRFYAACLTLALEALHGLHVVFRDLKPQNVVLDEIGYVKVVDFGFAKSLEEARPLTKTMCGTPDYMAPELAREQRHGYGVDWWALGALTYELATGEPPFAIADPSDTDEAMLRRICAGAYRWPAQSALHPTAAGHPLLLLKELVAELFQPDPCLREYLRT
jgi:serine/threonine protein kinase